MPRFLAVIRMTVVAAAVVFLCGPRLHARVHTPGLNSPAKPRHEVKNEIETLEKQWRDAEISGDTKLMGKLLDDGYVGISANGSIADKEQTIAARAAGTVTFSRLDFEDMKVRMYAGGSTAVVTSRAEVAGTNGGQDISGRYRFMRVYVKKLGTWRIVSFEASRIPDRK